jgi:hypothetical protein
MFRTANGRLVPGVLVGVVWGWLAAPVCAAPPVLVTPVRCTLGEDCFIQNYVDHDAGPDWRDYACGRLSYDGHKGTDFRVLDLAQMEKGVAVVAAAAGRVIGVRDGEPDVSVRVRGRENLNGRDAGNGVLIDHGDGWQTQYSHLRRGSVRVRMGQSVAAGDELGLVGLSGNTEFPHLDLTVRHNGQVVDPFTPTGGNRCNAADDALWRREVRAALSYRPTGVLVAALYGDVPKTTSAGPATGADAPLLFSAGSPRLAFYVEIFGAQAMDRVEFALYDPEGRMLSRQEATIPHPKAAWSATLPWQRPAGGWAPGRYRGIFRLFRAGRAEPFIEREAVGSIEARGPKNAP